MFISVYLLKLMHLTIALPLSSWFCKMQIPICCDGHACIYIYISVSSCMCIYLFLFHLYILFQKFPFAYQTGVLYMPMRSEQYEYLQPSFVTQYSVGMTILLITLMKTHQILWIKGQ
jgi:hypothetical protein